MIARSFDGVLFDLDDTLHDDSTTYRRAAERVAEEVAAERGVSAADLRAAYVREAEAFWASLSAEQLVVKLTRLRERMWGDALAAVGIRDEELTRRAAADYNRFRAEGLRLFPGVLPLLDGLRGAGKRTGLITNGFAETHREKIALLRLERAFTAVVLADEVGMIKPDPRIFLHACSLLGTAPAATVMVGDRYERDMAGALDAGLATIWFNLNDTTLPAGVRRPDAIVATFDGVCEALGFTSAPAEGTRA